ncbi:MAG: carboxymuconolactone decarboxylase family protein [Rhodospirillaceae bacterium]|nr:carboxymuconolactone decarboxylase family protein [Rhodospirillaceae bacterium]
MAKRNPSRAQGKSDAAGARAKKGEALRRRVLGHDHVNRSLAEADALTADLTRLIHEWVWHDIWSRPGLPLKTRSLINVALLTALNRPRELKLHLRGAFNNGCSVEEIREVLLHTALYAGVPATIDSVHVVRDTLKEMGHPMTARGTAKAAPRSKT